MAVSITGAAIAVIRRSFELAGSDPGRVGVRLRMAGGAVRPRFVSAPEPDDVVVDADGIRVFVAADLAAGGDVEIDVTEEHDTLTVRPSS